MAPAPWIFEKPEAQKTRGARRHICLNLEKWLCRESAGLERWGLAGAFLVFCDFAFSMKRVWSEVKSVGGGGRILNRTMWGGSNLGSRYCWAKFLEWAADITMRT